MLQNSSKSFQTNIYQFLNNLDFEERIKKELEEEICMFIMKIKHRKNIPLSMAKKLNISEKFETIKKQLENSKYIHVDLWSDCVLAARGEASTPDAAYLLSKFSLVQIAKVSKLPTFEEGGFKGNVLDIETGMTKKRNIRTHIKPKAHSLRYLIKYDPAIEKEDLEQELLLEAHKFTLVYHKAAGTNFVEGASDQTNRYLERMLNNKVDYLRNFYNRSSRRRLVSTKNDLYKKKNKLSKLSKKQNEEDKLKTMELIQEIDKELLTSEYVSTVSSLSSEFFDQERLPSPAKTENEESFVDSICKKLRVEASSKAWNQLCKNDFNNPIKTLASVGFSRDDIGWLNGIFGLGLNLAVSTDYRVCNFIKYAFGLEDFGDSSESQKSINSKARKLFNIDKELIKESKVLQEICLK